MSADAVVATFHQHRDGAYTVTLRYPWHESNHRHRVTREGPRGRLWCTRCGSQCGATVHLARYLATQADTQTKSHTDPELALC